MDGDTRTIHADAGVRERTYASRKVFHIHVCHSFTCGILSHTSRDICFRILYTNPPFYRMGPLLQVRQLSPTSLDTKDIQTNLAITYTLLPSPFSYECIYICMDVLSACMSVYHLWGWCPQEPEEVIRSPGTMWVLGIKPRSLEEHLMLLTIELSLQLHHYYLDCSFYQCTSKPAHIFQWPAALILS